MTKSEMVTQIKKIEKAFNRQFTKDQIEIWYEYLGKNEVKDFTIAVDKVILNINRFPTIADVCEFFPIKYRML